MWYQYSYIHNIDSIECSFFLMSNRIRWKSNKLIESRASGRKLLIIYTFKLCMFASSKVKYIGNNLSALWLPLSVEKYFCLTVMYNCNFRAYEEIVIIKLLIMLHDLISTFISQHLYIANLSILVTLQILDFCFKPCTLSNSEP